MDDQKLHNGIKLMPEPTPHREPGFLSNIRLRAEAVWAHVTQTGDARIVSLEVFLISIAVMLAWRLLDQAEGGDSAIWDYIAQSILRGQVPYRDVVEIKGPLSAYMSAAAMWLGKSVGLRDVLAVRFMQVLLAALLSYVTFLVTETYLRQRVTALIASLFPLMSFHFMSWTEGGTQPKLTMILFGMLSLLLIAKDKPFWAGCCSMLSCLCWQPGLLFTGIAVLLFSRYLTSWRDLRALKVLAGATIPLAITVLYFYRVGALTDFWIWTVAYNFEVYARVGLRDAGDTFAHIWIVLDRIFKVDVIWLALAAAGLLMFGARQSRARLNKTGLESPELFRDAILIAPVVYVAFCLVNLQSGPDLIPLFPFIGIFAGWSITEVSRRLRSVSVVAKKPTLRRTVELLPALALLLILTVAGARAARSKLDDPTLEYQDKQLRAVTDIIGPDDKIYVHGAVEILLLLDRPNLNPYIMWDHGKAAYVVAKKYGGSVDTMIDSIEVEAPKLVAFSRLRHIPEGAALERWVESHYDRVPISGYEIYLRKQ
jgi:hypothetical protein